MKRIRAFFIALVLVLASFGVAQMHPAAKQIIQPYGNPSEAGPLCPRLC